MYVARIEEDGTSVPLPRDRLVLVVMNRKSDSLRDMASRMVDLSWKIDRIGIEPIRWSPDAIVARQRREQKSVSETAVEVDTGVSDAA